LSQTQLEFSADCPHVYLNNIEIPRAKVAKYLGLPFDSKMTWNVHIAKKKKRKEMDLKIRKMYWFLGKKSSLPLVNNVPLYKAIIKPIWIQGIEL